MRRVAISFLVGLVWTCTPLAVRAEGPTFDCTKAKGTVEETICGDEYLSALDQQLDELFKKAMEAAGDEAQKLLRKEQRGWIKGRNDCSKATGEDSPIFFTESWKTVDVRNCVKTSYVFRISELQVAYGFAHSRGPFPYACEDDSAGGIDATFFKTDPPTVLLEREGKKVTAWMVTTGSGSKYEGQNVIFWAKGAEATVTWLEEQLTCSVRRD
jgi:uncharacterized protein